MLKMWAFLLSPQQFLTTKPTGRAWAALDALAAILTTHP